MDASNTKQDCCLFFSSLFILSRILMRLLSLDIPPNAQEKFEPKRF
jgi:hypothetical protein